MGDFLVFISFPKLFFILFFPCAIEGEEECSSGSGGHMADDEGQAHKNFKDWIVSWTF